MSLLGPASDGRIIPPQHVAPEGACPFGCSRLCFRLERKTYNGSRWCDDLHDRESDSLPSSRQAQRLSPQLVKEPLLERCGIPVASADTEFLRLFVRPEFLGRGDTLIPEAGGLPVMDYKGLAVIIDEDLLATHFVTTVRGWRAEPSDDNCGWYF